MKKKDVDLNKAAESLGINKLKLAVILEAALESTAKKIIKGLEEMMKTKNWERHFFSLDCDISFFKEVRPLIKKIDEAQR